MRRKVHTRYPQNSNKPLGAAQGVVTLTLSDCNFVVRQRRSLPAAAGPVQASAYSFSSVAVLVNLLVAAEERQLLVPRTQTDYRRPHRCYERPVLHRRHPIDAKSLHEVVWATAGSDESHID